MCSRLQHVDFPASRPSAERGLTKLFRHSQELLLPCGFLGRGWRETKRLCSLGNALKCLEPQRRVVQALRLWEGQRLPDALQQCEDATKPFCIADALVHAVAYRERINLAVLIEKHALRLRRREHLLARWRYWPSKVERASVGASGSRDEPHSVWLERVHLEPRVVLQVGEGLLDLERAEGLHKFVPAEWANNRRDELEVVCKQRARISTARRAELCSQHALCEGHQLVRFDGERTGGKRLGDI
mmetsp:Transcript_46146/g.107531  ORF Transcript_46146/g.107531 Transcript_46146/m.107531 type:complete len:244 (-) Transcript_46146:243-974(-)